MSGKMETLRFDVRKNENDEFWSVIDLFTGQAAWYEGIELNRLDFDEAHDLIACLNYLSALRMGTLKP
jgi:hypothetical protein